MRVRTVVDKDGEPTGEVSYWLYCPGCQDMHAINNTWEWDGDEEAPTFSPSILSMGPGQRCHSFVRAGVWEYLTDCDHELAGQRVPMVELPGWASA
jgi:hypothetical protein